MGGEQAANVLATVKDEQNLRAGKPGLSGEQREEFMRPILEKYDREGSPYYSTARLWDDGILDPAQTRRVLGLALSAALNAPPRDTRYGVFRM
jgi:acetyl-CoA carboxylase carboxyltransferase component